MVHLCIIIPPAEMPAKAPLDRANERKSALRFGAVAPSAVMPTGPAAIEAAPPSLKDDEYSDSRPLVDITIMMTSDYQIFC
jgi:hypothetical protein